MDEKTQNPSDHLVARKPSQRRPATRKMLEELQQVSDQIMRRRKEQLFEDSTEMIRQMREERSRELTGEE